MADAQTVLHVAQDTVLQIGSRDFVPSEGSSEGGTFQNFLFRRLFTLLRGGTMRLLRKLDTKRHRLQ